MTFANRRIVFAQRPRGLPGDECWKLVDGESVGDPGPDSALVEVEALSIDPAMRAWMDEEVHDFCAVIGRTMLAWVVICGAISQYNHRHDARGPKRYLRLAERNTRMVGFTVDHYASRFAEAEALLARWLRKGRLRVREHVVRGIENYPATLRMLFDGSHTGKLLLAPQGEERRTTWT